MTFPKSFQVGGSLPIPLTISNKTEAYTVVAGDSGTVINCTSGTFTVSLTAAATLLSGFNVTIWNTSASSVDVITIDPNASETIDGKATILLRRGEGMQIVCNGTNWDTGNKKVMRGYAENIGSNTTRPVASGNNSIAIGPEGPATASATNSVAIGYGTSAGIGNSMALGLNSGSTGSTTATGSGAMALGGSYASGTDSFAAAIANNTSTYGAQSANSVAIGAGLAKASAARALALMNNAIASGTDSIAIGIGCNASAANATAIGYGAVAAQIGKIAITGSAIASTGQSQIGFIVLLGATTDATPFILNSTNATANTTNQLILSNNQAMVVTGNILCRQSVAGSDKASAWTFTAVIRRGANAAATALVAAVTPVLAAQDASLVTTAVAVTADTTNGGLAVTVTGIAATNLRWAATLQSTELIYA